MKLFVIVYLLAVIGTSQTDTDDENWQDLVTKSCVSEMCVIFILDGSNAFSSKEFEQLKTMITLFVNMKSSDTATLFPGLLVISSDIDTEIYPDKAIDTFLGKLKDVKFPNGAEFNLELGFERANEIFSAFFPSEFKATPMDESKKAIIVIGGKVPLRPEGIEFWGDIYRQMGIHVYGIGEEGYDRELQRFTSDGQHSKKIINFANLETLPPMNLHLAKVDCSTDENYCGEGIGPEGDSAGNPCFFMLGGVRMAVAAGTYWNPSICSMVHDTKQMCKVKQ